MSVVLQAEMESAHTISLKCFIFAALRLLFYLFTAYVLSSAALMNAINPQQETILEPPRLINGSVTPVRGKTSVAPKMFKDI